MKAFSLFLALLFVILPAAAESQPDIQARAWVLTDLLSGQDLAEKNADQRVQPASLTKLMTAYLVFDALRSGKLALDKTLPVSDRARRAPGARLYLDPRKPATVEVLLKGMLVHSANDAALALAEGLAGSEKDFVARMNETTGRLGLANTHFSNATGESQANHYSTARDIARLAAALIRDFPAMYRYFGLKEISYNGITQINGNRLLWLDSYVDGLKTGHTAAAGWCLAASSRRGDRRLVSVVLGARSDMERTIGSQQLLNYGFMAYDTVKLYSANQPVARLEIYKGSANEVSAGFAQDFNLSLPKGAVARLKAQIISQQPLLAPVAKGKQVATLRLSLDDKVFGEYPMVAIEGVSGAGLFGRLWDTLRLLLDNTTRQQP